MRTISEAVARHAASAPRASFRPPTPAIARLALQKGVPLDYLDLSEDERALIIAGDSTRDFERERLPAAQRLLDGLRYRAWSDLNPKDHLLAVLAAVDDLRREYFEHPRLFGPGRPRKLREKWIPQEWDWALVMGCYLPWRYRQVTEDVFELPAPAWGSLDAPMGEDDGDQVSLGEVLSNREARLGDPALVVRSRRPELQPIWEAIEAARSREEQRPRRAT